MTADIKTRDKEFAIGTIASYLDDGYMVTAFKADDGVYEIYGHKHGNEQADCDHKCIQTEVGCEQTDCPWR